MRRLGKDYGRVCQQPIHLANRKKSYDRALERYVIRLFESCYKFLLTQPRHNDKNKYNQKISLPAAAEEFFQRVVNIFSPFSRNSFLKSK
jgi:hypothetical protein